ncbi:hypothetical protein [Bacteroides oleiciplenus]|uniref:hypothetical protein n=1 Tax=Bacteroides oleiciplenus TaxID=626931 RepID=UPI0005C4D7D6|nr:hypothetical protein [Bacteroides oleiciplenus]
MKFTIEVDTTGNGDYMEYKPFNVAPCKTVNYTFPKAFHARWIRFFTDKETIATTLLNYK